VGRCAQRRGAGFRPAPGWTRGGKGKSFTTLAWRGAGRRAHDAIEVHPAGAPQDRPETPRTAKNVLNRINEIASINGLAAELRALDRINRLIPGTPAQEVQTIPTGNEKIRLRASKK